MPLFIALFAIALGLIICFAGYRFFRLLLPIWGFFAGLWLGGNLLTALFGEGFLSSAAGLLAGVVIGVIFAVLSYLFWYIAFGIAGGFAGYWLFVSVWQAIGMEPNSLMTIMGVAVGVACALAFISLNAQKYFLIIVTALAGAGLAINGFLLLLGNADLDQLKAGIFRPMLDGSGVWTLVWVVLFILGLLGQLRVARGYRFSTNEW